VPLKHVKTVQRTVLANISHSHGKHSSLASAPKRQAMNLHVASTHRKGLMRRGHISVLVALDALQKQWRRRIGAPGSTVCISWSMYQLLQLCCFSATAGP